jgi:hypothetical protein
MIELLQNVVSALEAELPQLERQRASDGFVNDLYEAFSYWCDLGHWVLQKNTRVNYPERVRGERELLSKLETILRGKPEEARSKFGPLLSIGKEILQIVEAVQPPKNGHLGFLRIIRECFQFLESDFDFSITDEQPTSIEFTSGTVYLELKCSSDSWMSCLFGPEAAKRKHFAIRDLLFFHSDQRYLTLPAKVPMASESEIEDWFRFVADLFKQYGSEVLSNQPGIFDRLAQAQSQRDAEFVADMNKKYGEQQ